MSIPAENVSPFAAIRITLTSSLSSNSFTNSGSPNHSSSFKAFFFSGRFSQTIPILSFTSENIFLSILT